MAAQNHGPKPNTHATAQNVTPSNTVDLPFIANGLYIGGAGNLTFVNEDDTTVAAFAVTAGTKLDTRIKRVLATGTTATSIVAFFG